MTERDLIFPNEQYDAALSSIAVDWAFDSGYFVERMRQGGMSEAAISGCTYQFVVDTPTNEEKGTVTLGLCDYATNTVYCYLGWDYELANMIADEHLTTMALEQAKEDNIGLDELLAEGIPPGIMELKADIVSDILNNLANETLRHETDHLIEANTTDAEAFQARRDKYKDRVYLYRDLKLTAITWLMGGVLLAPMIEVYAGAPLEVVEKTFAGGMALAGLIAVIGNRYAKRLNEPLTHKEYTGSPWEIAARSAEQLAANDQDATQPFHITAKPLAFSIKH